MMSDQELDARLAAAVGVRDEALPSLPESFLDLLRNESSEDLPRTLEGLFRDEPASVVAARQLAEDARSGRRASFRARRRTLVRLGAGVLALAAAWVVAIAVASSDRPAAPGGRTELPSGTVPGAIDLVAAEVVTFPLTVEAPPPGVRPMFSRWGGVPLFGDQPLVHAADYTSDSGDRVLVVLYPEDPRGMDDVGLGDQPSGTVPVGAAEAEVLRGDGSIDLLWERPDGLWVAVSGEGAYSSTSALLPVAASIVDRPQSLDLQFGLAPAGWKVGGYEESRSIDLVSATQPDELLRLSLWAFGGDEALDGALEGLTFADGPEPVTIQGGAGRMALGDGGDGSCACWYVVGQLPGADRLFLLLGSDGLSREQMLAMAEQVTFTP
ncbi:hypothetical protein [Blastococcus goldschmidtiae]|uniref:DUF4367 domain-containing protein n=1 Tax=Blastococcus goldschmidtiae TaxID=3075546 RepID=A0ABU2K7E9_9ACTN|nr:hypothetical protein [Blastococcus sp. DSM 46792]MDT0276131.1 hypothetical protein [Blastococcus sp. DSM 46792]